MKFPNSLISMGLALTMGSLVALVACSGRKTDRIDGSHIRTEIDQIFSEFDDTSSPGCALGIQDHGETVLTASYGMADIASGIHIGPDTHFNIASISKQFTVLSILKLQAENKLSVDDDIRDYIPEIPVKDAMIRISDLIHHTSGLMDYTDYLYLAGLREFAGLQRDLAIDIMTADFPLVTPVGSTWSYNNGAYVLLAEIVNRVSGQRFEEFARQEVLAAVGMNASYFRSKNDPDFGPVANPYYITENGPIVSGGSVDYSGDGGLITTISDFLLYTAQIYQGKGLWNDTNRAFMTTSGKLNGPEVHSKTGTLYTDYGGALFLTPSHGQQLLSHTGSIDGVSARFHYYTDRKLAVIAFCNLSDAKLDQRFASIEDFIFRKDDFHGSNTRAPVDKSDGFLSAVQGSLLDSLNGTFTSEPLKSTWLIEPLEETGFAVTLSSPYAKPTIRSEYPLAELRPDPNFKYVVVLDEIEVRVPVGPDDEIGRFFVKAPSLPEFEFSRVFDSQE